MVIAQPCYINTMWLEVIFFKVKQKTLWFFTVAKKSGTDSVFPIRFIIFLEYIFI